MNKSTFDREVGGGEMDGKVRKLSLKQARELAIKVLLLAERRRRVINLDLSKDHQVSLDAIVRVINQEIQWCYQHPDMVSAEYHKAFIKGLEQAKHLVIKVAEVEE